MEKSKKIEEYLIKHPEKLRKEYSDTAKLFDATYEQVRSIARRIRASYENAFEVSQNSSHNDEKITTNEQKDSLVISVEDSKRVKSLDDLIRNCKVDLDTKLC